MLDERLHNAWHARERAVALSSLLHLAPDGLVFGVGTVVIAAEGVRRLRSLRGQEARVLALLSAAYGKPVNPTVLGNIERAAKSWSEGDDCLAHIHLAHTGLRALADPREAASPWSNVKSLAWLGEKFLDQAKRQVEAAGDRPITWYFAEPEAAEFARKLFNDDNMLRGRIRDEYLPWPERNR